MKSVLTKALSLFMVFLMTMSVIAIAPQAQAAEAGTLVSNPIILTDGEYYTKWWTSSNYSLNCYSKIEVPSRGYITFTVKKPFDNQGEIGSFALDLYKADGTLAWSCSTSAQKDSFSDSYVYKIGLDAGTYFMNLDPSFIIYYNSAPIESSYKYDFTADNHWEIESNNTKAEATVMELDNMYSAVYKDESYRGTYMDYFAFDLVAGKDYVIKIDNYSKLEAGLMLEVLLDPDDNVVSMGYDKENGTVYSWGITAEKTGRYYFKLYNDGNDAGVEYKIGVFNHTHTSDTGTIKSEPTLYSEGSKVYKCTECGRTIKTEVIPKIGDSATTQPTTRPNVNSSDTNNTQSTQKATKPSRVKLKSVKSPKKKRIVVTWNAVKDADGYQVLYSTSKKFVTKKTNIKTNIKLNRKATTYKTTIKKLKSKKKYFVKVRASKTVNGKALYGAWSKAKAVKVK